MKVEIVTDDTFDTAVLQHDGLVLVDFWAEWCGPCRSLGPILEELATTLASKVKIVKLNVDENSKTPSQFGVRSIPTLILFKGGIALETQVGALPKQNLQEWITRWV